MCECEAYWFMEMFKRILWVAQNIRCAMSILGGERILFPRDVLITWNKSFVSPYNEWHTSILLKKKTIFSTCHRSCVEIKYTINFSLSNRMFPNIISSFIFDLYQMEIKLLGISPNWVNSAFDCETTFFSLRSFPFLFFSSFFLLISSPQVWSLF